MHYLSYILLLLVCANSSFFLFFNAFMKENSYCELIQQMHCIFHCMNYTQHNTHIYIHDQYEIHPSSGALAVAWVTAKFTEPFRLVLTIYLIPKIARRLGRAPPKVVVEGASKSSFKMQKPKWFKPKEKPTK
jgi:hypothetical protein